jgi:hypothetical protein
MKLRLALLTCFSPFLISVANATEIYRWVDDSGHTQISDVVPDKYKDKASRVDSTQFDVSDADRAAAEARAKLLKTQAAAAQPAATKPAISSSRNKRPAISYDKSNCAAWQKLYTQSQECFAQFRNTNGSARAGGFRSCNEVPDPATTCGVTNSP